MKRNFDNYLAVVLATTAFLRVGLLVLSQNVLSLQTALRLPDTIGYDQLAKNILESACFCLTTGQATAWRMPGYPVFLATIYSISNSKLAVQLVQILFDVLTVWIVYVITHEITPQKIVWYITPVLVAINPLLIITSLILISETLTTAVLAVAVWILIRLLHVSSPQGRLWLTTLLFLTLTGGVFLRPTILFVSVFTATMLFIFFGRQDNWGQTARVVGIALSVTVITLSPWIIRNYSVMNAFVPLTTSSGTNFYGGNNPLADGGYVSDLPYILPGMTEIESNKVLTRKAVDWVTSNPVQFLTLLPRKATRHWSPIAFGTTGEFPLPGTIRLIANFVFEIFYLMVFLGGFKLIRSRHHWEALALLLVPLTLFVPSLITFGASRFAFPSFPELAILAVIGITQLLEGLTWVRKSD
jgi:hypothetical protein